MVSRKSSPSARGRVPTRGRCTRRNVLRSAATTLGSAILGACDAFSLSPGGGNRGNRESDLGDKEAPSLAKRVKKGDIPPLKDRLPEKPLVIEPTERPGTYGGEWRRALVGQPTAWLDRSIAYEGLVRWHPVNYTVVPNVAESVQPNSDGTHFRFTLRKRMKWSDGETYSAADIVFWYERVFLNDELTPVRPDWMMVEDEVATVEQVDDHTVDFTFPKPKGNFLDRLASQLRSGPTLSPQHYLEQFLPEINPDGIAELVERHGFDDWVELFFNRADTWANPELPTLHAWNVVEAITTNPSHVEAVRNPFYWKVDTLGRQLPYLDRVVHDVVADNESAVLKTMNGEYNLPIDINTPMNKPQFARNRQSGGYHFLGSTTDMMNEAVISLNLTVKDPVKREIFRNLDFRIGLSHAINREEIRDAVYQRQGIPWQTAPKPDRAEYYDEEMGTQYTEYSEDLANTHLDRAGYADRDEEGFRLGPDQERIRITVDVTTDRKPEWADVLELVREHWRAVGIDMQIKTESASLFISRMEANEPDAMVWHGDGGVAVLETAQYYVPNSVWCKYAPAWAHWYNGDPRGEEPPPRIVEQVELYREAQATIDPDRRVELMKQVLRIAREEFFSIGTIMIPDHYDVVTDDFHNVPDPVPYVDAFGSHARAQPCQFFRAD